MSSPCFLDLFCENSHKLVSLKKRTKFYRIFNGWYEVLTRLNHNKRNNNIWLEYPITKVVSAIRSLSGKHQHQDFSGYCFRTFLSFILFRNTRLSQCDLSFTYFRAIFVKAYSLLSVLKELRGISKNIQNREYVDFRIRGINGGKKY